MIQIRELKKIYDSRLIWQNVNISLQEDRIYCLMGPSGQGKTTLLRCLAGLEQPDSGSIEGLEGRKVSMVFQEDRILPEANAVENLRLVGIAHPETYLSEILPSACLHQPVCELSGGMKRRVSVARAMAAESDLILMDEPFTGLDEKTRDQVIDFIKKYRGGRLLVVTTHSEADAGKLGGERLRLPER